MDRLLENDMAARILSVILAVILWLQVSGQGYEAQTSIRSVAVRIRNLPPNLTAVAIEPDTVTVTVRGPRRDVARLTRADVEAVVDLASARPGRMTYLLDGVSVPPGITLVDFQPAQVAVTVAVIKEQEMSVRVRLEGKPADGFVTGQAAVEPARVVLRGPQNLLDKVASVEVPVSVERAREQVRELRPVAVLDKRGEAVDGVAVTPERVQVTVPVSEAVVARQVPVRAVVSGQPPRGYTVLGVETSPDFVTIRGPSDVVEKVAEVITEPVDVSEAREDVRATASLEVPARVQVSGDGRVDVVVRIGRQPAGR